MKVFGKNGFIKDSAMILEVSDEDLEKIKLGVDFVSDHIFCKRIYESKGNNAHITMLKASSYRIIPERIRELLKYYDSVSWWNKTQDKFCIRRGRKCHSYQQ